MNITDKLSFLEFHIAVKPYDFHVRYHDMIESLQFAVDIRSLSKVDFEFNNLMDFMYDTDFDDDDEQVFDIWREVVNDLSVMVTG